MRTASQIENNFSSPPGLHHNGPVQRDHRRGEVFIHDDDHDMLIVTLQVDPNLSEEDLDGIIAEIDEDGSGTMDFDEFCEMMMTSPEDQES